MNEILNAMINRRSVRAFRPDLPEKAMIEEIINAGLYAPSGMGRQAVNIIAVTRKDLRDRISEVNREIFGQKEGFDPFYGAPVILLVIARKDVSTRVYDGSLVMGNLMLGAYSLGLGSIWIHRAKEELERQEFKDLLKELGIEGEWEGIGHCAIGYPAGELPSPAERKDNRVYWVE